GGVQLVPVLVQNSDPGRMGGDSLGAEVRGGQGVDLFAAEDVLDAVADDLGIGLCHGVFSSLCFAVDCLMWLPTTPGGGFGRLPSGSHRVGISATISPSTISVLQGTGS